MRRTLSVLAFLAVAVAAFPQVSERDIFLEAETRYRNQDYELALERYDSLIRQFPRSQFLPDAQFKKAVSLYRLGRYNESYRLLQRVEARFRSTRYLPFVPFWKGVVQYYRGETEASISEFERFLRAPQDDVHSQALLYKALGETALDRTDAAIATLERLVERTDRLTAEAYAVSLLMTLYVQNGRYRAVRDLYERIDVDEVAAGIRPSIRVSAAEAFFAGDEYDISRDLFNELRGAPIDIAAVAFQRLFQIAQITGREDDLNDILRDAEVRLAGRTDILKEFWFRVGLESYERRRFELAELYMRRVWDLRRSEEVPGAAALYLAELLHNRGETAVAITVLTEALELGLDEPEKTLFRLGGLHIALGQWSEAISRFGEFQAAFPASDLAGQAAYHLAFSHNKMGDRTSALGVIDRVFSEGRGGAYTSDLLRLKANIQRRAGDVAGALVTLQDYLPLNRADLDARIEQLTLVFQQERYPRVVELGAELAADFPNLAESNRRHYATIGYLVGLAHIVERQYTTAIPYLERIDPDLVASDEFVGDIAAMYPYALYYRGWAYYRAAEYERTVTYLTRLITVEPTHALAPRAAYIAGWSSYSLGRFDEAEELLRRIRSWDVPAALRTEADFLLGQTLLAAGSLREAMVEFRSIFLDHPRSEFADDAMYEYAGILVRLDRLDDAVEQYFVLYERYPDSPLAEEGLYRRGEILLNDGRYSAARDAFFEYRTRFPDGRLVHASLYWGGIAAFELNEESGAILLWERLITQHRDSPFRPEAMNRTALAYERGGELRNALNTLAELSSAYPDYVEDFDVRDRMDRLVLRIGGLNEREAELWVRAERENYAQTTDGRHAILELGRLILFEGTGSTINENLVIQMLQETAGRASDDPAAGAQAMYLLGEFLYRRDDFERASTVFLEAAATHPDDRDLVALSLYRASEMLKLSGRDESARELLRRLERDFPTSEWTREAQRLLGGN